MDPLRIPGRTTLAAQGSTDRFCRPLAVWGLLVNRRLRSIVSVVVPRAGGIMSARSPLTRAGTIAAGHHMAVGPGRSAPATDSGHRQPTGHWGRRGHPRPRGDASQGTSANAQTSGATVIRDDYLQSVQASLNPAPL